MEQLERGVVRVFLGVNGGFASSEQALLDKYP